MNFDHILTCKQPKGLNVELFKHQLASIHKMEIMEEEKQIECNFQVKESRIGILAEETGRGKTLTVIGLIARDKMAWDLDIPFPIDSITLESGGLIRNHVLRRYDKYPTNLVLISSSIVHQWVEELNKSNLKYFLVTKKKSVEITNIEDFDIILVTPNMYNIFLSHNANFAWKRFIFDEPGHERVSCMKAVVAGFYWLITATPLEIVNQHRNCKNSFMNDVILQNIYTKDDFERVFSGLIIKHPTDYLNQSFRIPNTLHKHYKCYQPLIDVVSDMVSSDIELMIEGGNIDGVISKLGGNKTSNVVELIRTSKLKKIEKFKILVENITNGEFLFGNENDSEMSDDMDFSKENEEEILKKYNSTIARLETQINLLEERFSKYLTEDCIICMKKKNKPVLEPQCQSLFCGACLFKWLKNNPSCPICRMPIDSSSLVFLENFEETKSPSEEDDLENNKSDRIPTKEETIVKIIKENARGKFIIFSAYDDSFNRIRNSLSDNGILFVEMKGDISTRVSDFKNGNIPVIFLNSTHSGCGLNLQETTDIILYHRMNPSIVTQIIGRANRIGRTNGDLLMHYLE